MAILRGHFAVMLIVAVPEEVPRSDLEARLDRVRTELGLEAVAVSPVEQVDGGPAATHVLSVYGSDHPGIVASVSRAPGRARDHDHRPRDQARRRRGASRST